MTYEPHGKHLIAGDWVTSDTTFTSRPITGDGQTFSSGGKNEVDRAVEAAEEAFLTYGWTTRDARAKFLDYTSDAMTRYVLPPPLPPSLPPSPLVVSALSHLHPSL